MKSGMTIEKRYIFKWIRHFKQPTMPCIMHQDQEPVFEINVFLQVQNKGKE